MNIIEAINIHKSYSQLQVLKGITLEVREQEIVSIVGASGAGKTTLLQILGTLETADQGELFISGKKINGLSSRVIAQTRNASIGFIFQNHQLLPEFTALENIMLPALIGGKSKRASQEHAKDLLALLNLSDRSSHKPSELSGGECQRIAVGRALMNEPSIIFADEPSGSLDSKNKEELHNLFFELREILGQTFVIVTHDVDLARRADRMFTLKDGLLESIWENPQRTVTP